MPCVLGEEDRAGTELPGGGALCEDSYDGYAAGIVLVGGYIVGSG
jgi:hypothetical protein